MKFYERADGLNGKEQETFKVFKNFSDIKAVNTHKFRIPKKGEWFLSGAIPQAYRAFSDMTTPYWIAKLVKTKTEIIITICE